MAAMKTGILGPEARLWPTLLLRYSMFGPLTTTEVGVIGLWIAALLTLVTGYDYLRAGLRHVEAMDSDEAEGTGDTTDARSASDAG